MRVYISKHAKAMFVLFIILPFISAVGFAVIEKDYTVFDSFYLTVTTLAGLGTGEKHPLSLRGKIFLIFVVFSSAFTFYYASSELVKSIVSGEVKVMLKIGEDYGKQLAAKDDHVIVCGYGRIGKHICQDLSDASTDFVIVDNDPHISEIFDLPFGLVVTGDATSDAILLTAGVKRARVLIAVTPSDADNLYITMSARLLSNTITIISRSESDEAECKLKRAGANHVVAPYALGGHTIAQIITPQLEHKERHAELHQALDELTADYMLMTGQSTTSTISDLLLWSRGQIVEPSTTPVTILDKLKAASHLNP